MDRYRDELLQTIELYTKTKLYILRAEQTDPDARSNIAVFKEQRDAADHLMRALGEALSPQKKGSESDAYIKTHFEKIKSHLFRAAFDSLDGLGVSLKIKADEALKDVSTDALSAVFPKYWEHLNTISNLDDKITSHRNNKDVGRATIETLNAYSADIDQMSKIVEEILKNVPGLRDWDMRKSSELKRVEDGTWKRDITIAIISILGTALVSWLVQ